MKKFWVKKTDSFEEAEEFDDEYYRRRTFEDRLSDIQLCRDMYFKLKRINVNACRKRLRRLVRVI